MADRRNRRRIARLTAVAAVASLVLVGCGPFGGGNKAEAEARKVGEAFLVEWSANKLIDAGALTTDPEAAETALREVQTDLRPDRRELAPGEITGCSKGKPCTLAFDVVLGLNALGNWRYSSSLNMVQVEDKVWKVDWAPSLIHPQLTPDTKLRRVRELPSRAPILDRNGKALVTEQTVKRVGVEAGKIPDGTIEDLAELLDVNVDGLAIRANRAPAGQFVLAVVLRMADYEAIESKLDEIDGVVVQDDKLTLAPTRAYARAVLGSIDMATSESLKNAGPWASVADSIGTSGLQKVYQLQLAGRPGGRVDIVRRESREPVARLAEFTQLPGKPVGTTLDFDIQTAAEDALELTTENSSLVAIDTKTGDILAVANGPTDKAGEPRALTGQYAPGSTFKIITATALLRDGVEPDDTVDCPNSVSVDGKRFENYDGLGALGRVSFRRDFAASCNSAFAKAAAGLDADDLTDAAASFGIGRPWDLGLSAFPGDVPPSFNDVDRAAAGIGQGRVLMSPLAMAVVAATVADGTPREPRLVTSGPPDPAYALDAPAAGEPTSTPIPTATIPGGEEEVAELEPLPEADTLRELMYETVRSGTARVLQIPGQKVGAKTGTAEYGSETEPGKHAWMVGFSGGIAFAVIVENGDTGAITAGPIAKAFLQAVADRV